ncbi:MAG TPA: outer membrane protein assembly factor BamA [Caulobacteraceae bacterium]|jgi:outer membrane protein insertion porin family|nr:outer membrane protein assembly factor BamA [Caulobacteraceae bacterium]
MPDTTTGSLPAAAVLAVSSLAALLAGAALPAAALAQPAAAAPPAAESAPSQAQPSQSAPGVPPPAAVPAPQTGVVGRIDIRGEERIDPETILSYLPIHVGEAVDPAKIDTALKALFATDLFSDVKIDLQGSDLVVQVVENPIINQVLFEGNSNVKTDKLQDEIQVRPRGVFTRAKVEEDVGRIVELYRREGRISAVVTPKIVQLPQRRVDLIFEIKEGPKSGIIEVNFLGNKKFSNNDLSGVVVTKASAWYRFFSTNDNYDPDRIEYDREQLRKFYRNRGYYDFRIISSVAELDVQRNGFAVTYTLDEGQMYRFGKVTVRAELKKLNPDILRAILPIRSGQVYSDDRIEKATDALTFAAGAAGFAFVDVRPRYTPNPRTHTVDVVFDVKEGPRVYIGRIDIVGNTQTLDYVIRRQLSVAEGDAYNRALVDRSKQAVRNLGFFKDVDITNTPGDSPDKTNLLVKVTEQPTGQLSFSAGYSSIDKIVTDVGISQSNFRGRGETVSARASVGYLQQLIDLSFSEPHWLNRDLTAGWDLYAQRYDFTQYADYVSESVGATAHVAFPLARNALLTTRYTIRTENISINPALCIPGEQTVSVALCSEGGAYLTSSVGYTLGYDARNDSRNPTRGFYVNVSQDVAGFGGTVHYVSSQLHGGFYHGFNKDFIFDFTGGVKYIDGWNGDSIRIGDRFYEGGDTFRGFNLAGVGPRDIQFGDALGGKLSAIGTLEETFPNGLPEQYGIKTLLFVDFGTVGLLDKSDLINQFTNQPITTIRDDLNLRASAGISVFWRSPMGPLRFDLSQIIKKDSYDQTMLFYFSTSTRF